VVLDDDVRVSRTKKAGGTEEVEVLNEDDDDADHDMVTVQVGGGRKRRPESSAGSLAKRVG